MWNKNEEERFFSHVNKTDTCWLWTGCTAGGGYGQFSIGSKHVYAHRMSWILNGGDIPNGEEVCHTCDTPLCVNPEHLFTAPHKKNMADMNNKNRHGKSSKTHCPAGHEFTTENTYYQTTKNGLGRKCRICNREQVKQYRCRQKAGKDGFK